MIFCDPNLNGNVCTLLKIFKSFGAIIKNELDSLSNQIVFDLFVNRSERKVGNKSTMPMNTHKRNSIDKHEKKTTKNLYIQVDCEQYWLTEHHVSEMKIEKKISNYQIKKNVYSVEKYPSNFKYIYSRGMEWFRKKIRP